MLVGWGVRGETLSLWSWLSILLISWTWCSRKCLLLKWPLFFCNAFFWMSFVSVKTKKPWKKPLERFGATRARDQTFSLVFDFDQTYINSEGKHIWTVVTFVSLSEPEPNTPLPPPHPPVFNRHKPAISCEQQCFSRSTRSVCLSFPHLHHYEGEISIVEFEQFGNEQRESIIPSQ